MLKKAKEDLSLLTRSGKHIFVFELTYKLAATAIVYPLAVLVLNLVFSFAGISYLTNEYILKAVTNPAVILTLVLLIVLFVLYCSYEMSFLTTCFELKRQECTASIIETGLTALKHIRPLFQIKNIPLALFYFIMILTINVAICGNVLYSQTAVNLFKTYILRNTWFVKGALIAGTLIIYTVMIFGIYSFHVFMLEGVDFSSSDCRRETACNGVYGKCGLFIRSACYPERDEIVSGVYRHSRILYGDFAYVL